jgi:cell division initiation protein
MKLTPLDIRHKDFKRGMRGYTEVDVDEFLDNVAEEFERVFKENIELTERLDTLQEQITHYRTIEATLQKTLVSAQQTAEGVRGSAEKESQLILRDADMRARDLVGEAERKARDLVNEAYVTKQTVENETLVLQHAEADFRFKFRQLLEGYLEQIGTFDATARERAAEFARRVEELKGALALGGTTTEEMAAPTPAGEPESQPPAAETAPKPSTETVVPMPVRPVGVTSTPVQSAASQEAPVSPATFFPEPSGPQPSVAPAPEAPAEAEWPAAVETQPPAPKPQVERPWWEPIPAEGNLSEDDQTAATRLEREAEEDAAALRGSPVKESEAAAGKPAEPSRLPEDDEFLSDVDDTVGDNEFKW